MKLTKGITAGNRYKCVSLIQNVKRRRLMVQNDEEQMKIQCDKALWFTANIDEARSAETSLQ
ncbi:MAG: hypothetical protein ACRD8W_26860 [Nitrososphaeraceae archaeon]